MKTIPTFQCYSCGNCELNFHKEDSDNENNGFCMRFFQNVPLEEKNISCWTSKKHTYYEDLANLKPTLNKSDYHKRNKRANQLKLELKEPNQLNLFS
ncbi:hypothetical protein [Flavobacterium hibisci]|uniref:hypothetical protein n=1 Tax=Flavobacterium hibisci TaxID=1914462 RepID=UPI001CBCE647|nr:hypothetical protein [Flavobacterium hibisci]MBZ4040975.1 hypothetical protein [Flavobacterium hibisci]